MSDEEKKDDFLEEDFTEEFEELGESKGPNRKRLIVLLLILFVSGGVFFYLTEEDTSFDDDFSLAHEEIVVPKKFERKPPQRKLEKIEGQKAAEKVHKKEDVKKEKKEERKEKDSPKPAHTKAKEVKAMMGMGALALAGPMDGESYEYDLSRARPKFSWTGDADKIIFSRNRSLKPAHTVARVKGTEYEGRYFEPGTWYWQVKNGEGTSSVRSFTVLPSRIQIPKVIMPENGAELNGNSGTVNWTMTERSAFYRVQLTQKENWVAPNYLFATSGTKLMLKGVTPGSYKLRVGSFSEVSGRWEYSSPVQVEVR